MAGLIAGLQGAGVLSVFSSILDGDSFLLDRAVPATAVIFSEPNPSVPRTSISKRSSSVPSKGNKARCQRPIFPIGRYAKKTTADLKYVIDSIYGYYLEDHIVTKSITEPILDRLSKKATFIGTIITIIINIMEFLGIHFRMSI